MYVNHLHCFPTSSWTIASAGPSDIIWRYKSWLCQWWCTCWTPRKLKIHPLWILPQLCEQSNWRHHTVFHLMPLHHLYLRRLACDVLCIPELPNHHQFPYHGSWLRCCIGSAVAVERVFSGGWDTISLRRASLNANTIRILMLVKSQVHAHHPCEV